MKWIDKVDGIYVIDSNMLGFEHYSSIYLIKGEKLALIDTGQAAQFEKVCAGIEAHGFSVSDISYIFVTHGHGDHDGNVGSFVKANPKITVYVHPKGLERLIDPETGLARSLAAMPPKMAATFRARAGVPLPVPREHIQLLNDGEVFNLGNNKELEVIFAPGHQPNGIVLIERNSKGLFINDLVGNYFEDADVQISLTPAGSDVKQAIKTLEKLMSLSPDVLFLGHFGVCYKPKEIMQRAIDDMKQLLKIGTECIMDGKLEEISSRIITHIVSKLEKIKAVRGENQYNYLKDELAPNFGINFAKYIQAQHS